MLRIYLIQEEDMTVFAVRSENEAIEYCTKNDNYCWTTLPIYNLKTENKNKT